MPVYEYHAIDNRGKATKGSLDADSVRGARQKLRALGLTPTIVQEGKVPAAGTTKRFGNTLGKSPPPLTSERVSARSLTLATRQLATLLVAGIPLVEAIQSMADQSSIGFRRVLIDIRERVEQGSSFAKALGHYPRVFPRLYIHMVASGEASGKLDSVLESLAEYLETQLELRRKLSSALIYPIVMLCLCVVVVAGLFVFVVPQIVEIFTKQGAELPLPTTIMITISDCIVYYWYVLGLLLAATVYGAIRIYNTPRGRQFVDKTLLRLPIIGPLYTKVITARIARTLATMLASGVGLLESLDMAKNIIGNVLVQDALKNSKEGVREGRSLARELTKSNIFPQMLCQMVAVGERSGKLETMLATAGTTYEKEAAAAIVGLSSLVEPLMIIMLGVIVISIVVSVLLPMTSLMDLVAK